MSDEVYIVRISRRLKIDTYVLGYLDDAQALREAAGENCVDVDIAQVLDHADARRLIEQEEG